MPALSTSPLQTPLHRQADLPHADPDDTRWQSSEGSRRPPQKHAAHRCRDVVTREETCLYTPVSAACIDTPLLSERKRATAATGRHRRENFSLSFDLLPPAGKDVHVCRSEYTCVHVQIYVSAGVHTQNTSGERAKERRRERVAAHVVEEEETGDDSDLTDPGRHEGNGNS